MHKNGESRPIVAPNELFDYPWFHGVLTRSQVELVMHPRHDGLYLVRESTSSPGTYLLCVCHKDEILKFVIERRERGFIISYGAQKVYPKGFNSVADIVQHFKKERNGMPTKLTTPIKRRVLGIGVWEYQYDDGHWYSYPAQESRLIEQALVENINRLKLEIDGHNYTVMLDSRLQRSEELGTERKIRRRQVTATESEIKGSQLKLKLTRSKSGGALSPTTLSGRHKMTSLSEELPNKTMPTRSRSFHHSKPKVHPVSPPLRRAVSPGRSAKGSRTRPGSPNAGKSPNIYDSSSSVGVIRNRKPVLPRPRLLSNEEAAMALVADLETMSFDADDEIDSEDEEMMMSPAISWQETTLLDHMASPEQTKRQQKAPIYWSSPEKTGFRSSLKLVPLLTSSMEYNRILNAMLKSMPVSVQRIARVENVDLWEAYCRKRDLMERKHGLSAEKVKECSLFHGTKTEYTSSICRQNFDFRLSGQHGALFGMSSWHNVHEQLDFSTFIGHGNYFAVTAARAAMYSPPDQDGNRHMFVCKVLVGEYTQGRQGLRRPPLKYSVSQSFDLYDSVCDEVHDPSAFVVFDNDQAYPDYIITYR
eukprot:m.5425 g.5425  ORF g.5425 m.5425 type:complete len:590 (+) comp13154_c0_seq2:121-1890(+)